MKQLSAILPSGEEKILVFNQCVACHGPAQVQQRLEVGRSWPVNYWEDLILQMIHGWGATIEIAEVPLIARYLSATYGGGPSTDQAELDALPDGAEKKLLETRCFTCHNREITARRITARRGLPAPVWRRVIARMGDYGARLSETELSQLSEYLERTMGARDDTADAEVVNAFASALPDGDGKNVVLAVCLSCHGPGELRKRIAAAPSDDSFFWERVVKRMQSRWEAPLTDGDVVPTVKYLNAIAPKLSEAR